MKYNYFYHIPNGLLIFLKIYNSLLNFFFEIQIIAHIKFFGLLIKAGNCDNILLFKTFSVV